MEPAESMGFESFDVSHVVRYIKLAQIGWLPTNLGNYPRVENITLFLVPVWQGIFHMLIHALNSCLFFFFFFLLSAFGEATCGSNEHFEHLRIIQWFSTNSRYLPECRLSRDHKYWQNARGRWRYWEQEYAEIFCKTFFCKTIFCKIRTTSINCRQQSSAW